MKCKCIKSDPLEWMKIGKIYNILLIDNCYFIESVGFAVSEELFKELFEPIEPK